MRPEITKKKPSFYVRLSGLIICQVLFVFLVTGLILFYPVDRPEITNRFENLKKTFVETGIRIENTFTAHGGYDGAHDLLPIKPHLDSVLLKVEPIAAAGIYTLSEDNGLIQSFSWIANRGTESEPGPLVDYDADLVEPAMINYLMNEPAGCVLVANPGTDYSVHYYRLENLNGTPAAFVSVMEHGLLISDRSTLSYFGLLLLLVSVLVSLLTIYLITVRVKRPLNRLLTGLEKTTGGELFYTIETESDGELNRLVDSYNKMTHTLWNNQKSLKEYNASLESLNQSLLENQLFLTTLVDSTPLSVVATSPSGEIMLFNGQASEMFGYSTEEAVSLSMADLFAQAPGTQKFGTDREIGQPGFEARCCRKDGGSFPAYVIAAPVQSGENEAGANLFIIKDISESKGFLDMMIRLDRYYTRGQMAGDIAHEINNYLAVLGGNVELLPILLRKGQSEKLDHKLELMRGTVDKIAKFAEGLMDVPQDQCNLEKADLNQLVENVLAFLKPQNRFDGVELKSSLCSELPLVPLDPGQIEQLLTNFVFNAAEAMSSTDGPKRVTVRTEIVAGVDGSHAVLEVADNGPGVALANRERLFEERFTTKRKGHGIGLVTCRRISDAHGGRISYRDSRPGAIFRIELPLAVRAGETPQAGESAAEHRSEPVAW